MKEFGFNEAYMSIVKASVEQDRKEIPLLLSSTNFRGRKCLEIGAGPLARLAIKLLESDKAPSHITCLDPWNVEVIRQIAKQKGLKEKIAVYKPDDPGKFPFKDNSFDIVYAGWIPTDLLKDENYLDELARVSKKDIVLIMSGLNGDIPEMRDKIFGENERQKRAELRQSMTNYFESLGYKVDTSRQTTLKLDFPDLETIFNTFHFFDFKNGLSEQDAAKLRMYLEPKVHNFKDNLYIFHAWKEED